MVRFHADVVARLEHTLAVHAAARFPGHAAYLGEERLLQVVRRAHHSARARGFSTEDHVRAYTEFVVMLGTGFDTDPQLEWASEVLDDTTASDPRSRIEALRERAEIYMETVLTPGEVFPGRAFRTARQHALLCARPAKTPGNDELHALLRNVWPEKARYVGPEGLSELIRASAAEAARFGIGAWAGRAEFAALTLLLGHRFHADPLYPWVGDALKTAALSRRGGLLDEFDVMLRVMPA